MGKIWKKKSWLLQMAIGTVQKKKGLIDPVTSWVRTWLMFRDGSMDAPWLPVQGGAVGQGVKTRHGPAWTLCLGPLPSPACCACSPHSASHALGWPTGLGAELKAFGKGCSHGFSSGSGEQTSWKGWVWTPTKLPSCWLLEGWNFLTLEVQRQFTDSHCWPHS